MWRKTDLGYEKGELLVGPPPNEESLAYSYLALKRSGEFDNVFHQSHMPLKEYLAWLTEPNITTIGLWLRPTSDVVKLAGFAFFNQAYQIEGLNKAEVGFAFWDEPLSVFTKVQVIQRYMDYLFVHSDTDAIFGLTPERNDGAVALIRRAGMRLYGPIPMYCGWHGEACGAWISQMDRASWMNNPRSMEY